MPIHLHNRGSLGGANHETFSLAASLIYTFVGSPKVIMFDEPAAGLSSEETEKLGELILSIYKHTGAKTLVIDHDVDLIAKICEETLVLDFGERIAFGKTSKILSDPKVRAAYLGVGES